MSSGSHGLASEVVERIRVLNPGMSATIENEDVILVDGRRLATANLLRMIANNPTHRDHIITAYLRSMLTTTPALCEMRWVDVRASILPRFISSSSNTLHTLDEPVPHVEFGNGTRVVFVVDQPDRMLIVRDEARAAWRISADELMVVARRNLAAIPCTPQATETREGGRAVLIKEADGYDASRLLLPSLHPLLGEHLGRDFYAAIPARDTLIAFRAEHEALRVRLQSVIDREHASLPYPITTRLFLVTRDGVAGTEEGGAAL